LSGRTHSAGEPESGRGACLDRSRLIEDNVGLAHHLVRRFARYQGTNPDLVQAAMVGLVEAASRFDPSYGVPFAAFATKTILGELKRHRRDTGWSVHVGRRTKELALRLPAAVQALHYELGRSPTPDEVADSLGVSVELCLQAMEASTADRPMVDGWRLAALEALHDPHFSKLEERDAVARWLGRLGDVEREVVFSYFWGELSQADIAERLGVSQMAVSRMLSRALDRMRGWAEATG